MKTMQSQMCQVFVTRGSILKTPCEQTLFLHTTKMIWLHKIARLILNGEKKKCRHHFLSEVWSMIINNVNTMTAL